MTTDTDFPLTTREHPDSRWHMEADSRGSHSWACIPITAAKDRLAAAEACSTALAEALRTTGEGHQALHRRGVVDCPICSAIRARALLAPPDEEAPQ